MEINLQIIKVRDLIAGYSRNEDTGRVVGYHGNLDIRPPYQREFVYNDEQRNKVIETINQGFPLNTMYWNKKPDGTFEVLDGQQRTISICEYCSNEFAVNYRGWINLTEAERNKILDYELYIYICEGSESDKLKWFETINISGVELTKQELLNIAYTGSWLADARKKFSSRECPAKKLGEKYLAGSAIRQEYLETAISWIAEYQNKRGLLADSKNQSYMSKHQHDINANELWKHFEKVITWFRTVFPTYYVEMKGLDIGHLYSEYESKTVSLDSQVARLMEDDDVTKKKGIFEYLLSGELKHLSIRKFDDRTKKKKYDEQKGICPRCVSEGGKDKEKKWPIEEMEADHIIPWSEGGRTELENCQLLCRFHNRSKGKK